MRPLEYLALRRDWTPENALAFRAEQSGRTVEEIRATLDTYTQAPAFVMRRLVFPVEYRESSAGNEFVGYASITETAYTVAGGPPYGWNETIARGAFAKTLSESPDVVFLVNHEGLPLARTTSGTLSLAETTQGLEARAMLDLADPSVAEIVPKMRRGDLTEMSFAFRGVRQEWTNPQGEPVDSWEGTERRISEVSLARCDVSVVTYGANPHTVATLRAGTPAGMSRSLARAILTRDAIHAA